MPIVAPVGRGGNKKDNGVVGKMVDVLLAKTGPTMVHIGFGVVHGAVTKEGADSVAEETNNNLKIKAKTDSKIHDIKSAKVEVTNVTKKVTE